MATSASNMKQSVEKVVDQISERVSTASHREGELTKRLEAQTSKIPSMAFFNLALGSMVLSAGVAVFAQRKSMANFVGLWAPTFLLLGIYNKLMKLEGPDRYSSEKELDAAS
jgi:hypothetical protein